MNLAHSILARLIPKRGDAIEFAASYQDWNEQEEGNPFHTLLAYANPKLVADTLRFKQCGQSTKPPNFLVYSPMRIKGTIQICVDALDPHWLKQTRSLDGATPLHLLFHKLIHKEALYNSQEEIFNWSLVERMEHIQAPYYTWYLAKLFEEIGGDFYQEDATGTSLADLIVLADHSLNPEYGVSEERQELRKLEAFIQAKFLERHTVDNRQKRTPRERL